MNLKERGITVGDILLFLIFLISIFLITNKVRNNNEQGYIQNAPKVELTTERYQ